MVCPLRQLTLTSPPELGGAKRCQILKFWKNWREAPRGPSSLPLHRRLRALGVVGVDPRDCCLGRFGGSVAVGVVASGLVFLVTYFVKDAGWNALPSQTQKLFVASEVAWVILCHVYVLICVRLLQRPALDAPRSHLDMKLDAGGDAAGQGARSG